MSKSQNNSGLMSSAGLVRYFEQEERDSITIDPKTVATVGLLLGILVMFLRVALV